jgi:hypothetical protein
MGSSLSAHRSRDNAPSAQTLRKSPLPICLLTQRRRLPLSPTPSLRFLSNFPPLCPLHFLPSLILRLRSLSCGCTCCESSETSACSSPGLTSELSFLGPLLLLYSITSTASTIPFLDTLVSPSQAPAVSQPREAAAPTLTSPYPSAYSVLHSQLPTIPTCASYHHPAPSPAPARFLSRPPLYISWKRIQPVQHNRSLAQYRTVKSFARKTHRIRNHVCLSNHRSFLDQAAFRGAIFACRAQ